MTQAKTFYDLARVNTGAHMLDSGGAYGRHWEDPPIPKDHPLYYARRWGDGLDQVDLMMNQPSVLSECYDIDPKATRHFHLWAALADPHDRHHWGELAEAYCARMIQTGRWESGEIGVEEAPADPEFGIGWYAEQGRRICYRDYTYNDPDCNDLDQDFVLTAPSPYSEKVLIQSHNGCDARGGFTAPVVAVGGEGPPETGIRPYCPTCHAEADNMYYAARDGWRLVRLSDKAVLRCPEGHLETYPEFPYMDSHGPEPDRSEPHDPDPDHEGTFCTWCGIDIERDGDDWEHKPGPQPVPKEQLALPMAVAS